MKFFDVSPNIIMLCLPGLLALPVALFAPLGVLENHNLDTFVKFVEIFVPMIKRIDPFLDTWQVAKLFYSVAWSCVPICIAFWLRRLRRDETKFFALINMSKIKRIMTILVVWIFILFIWYAGFSDHESGRAIFMTYSRVGMATIGAFLISVEAFMAAIALITILKFREFITGDSNA